MNEKPKYYDIHSSLWRESWDKALPFKLYIESDGGTYRGKWEETYNRVVLSEEQRKTICGFVRKLQVLVLSGVWCGDCSRQGPIIQKIVEAGKGLEARFLDNRRNPQLQDELRINGAMKVPVAVFLNEDFFELGRFGDRHLAVYRMKLETETGNACSTGLAVSQELLSRDIRDWVDLFERMHAIVRLAPAYRRKYGD